MRRLALVVALALGCAGWAGAAYTYDYPFNGDSNWALNGSMTYYGSYIYKTPPVFPNNGNPNDYAVSASMGLGPLGGKLLVFLRANSSTVQSGVGSYVSIEADMASLPWVQLTVNETINGPDGYTGVGTDGMGHTVTTVRGPNSATIQSVVDSVYAPCAYRQVSG